MEHIFIRILNMSISAAWLILAILLLRIVLRKAPKWLFCALWGLAALRLILPFSIESILSLIPSSETIPTGILYAQSPFVHSGIPSLNTVVNPIISESFAPDPSTSANPLQIILFFAALVWIAGIAVMLGYALFSTLRLRHRLKTATLLKDNIYQSEYVSSPFVFGMFRPQIYLPYHINSADTTFVIAHESAHIRRWDHITKPLGFLILSLHWFNPLVWLAYSLYAKDLEFACDEHVIEDYTASERQAYSSALLNCSLQRKKLAANSLAFGETSIKQRVRSIMTHKHTPLWIIIICIVICAVLALCFLTDPISANALLPIEGEYAVESVVYQNRSFSYIQSEETLPSFSISANMELTQTGMPTYGIMHEIILSKENFDAYFDNHHIWYNSDQFSDRQTPAILRRNNARAWIVTSEEEIFTLLQQKDGSLFLVWGVDNSIENRPFVMDIYRLKSLNTSIIGGADGPTSIFTTSRRSVGIIGGADGPTSIFITQNSDEVSYRYHASDEPILPTVTLWPEKKEFGFCYSGFSSYYPYGLYEINGDELILKTEDGKNTYVFRIENNSLIFNQAQSSVIPSYANIPDGAVFEKE